MAPGVVDGEVDGLTGHKAEVSEQRVGDLHPWDEGLVRYAGELGWRRPEPAVSSLSACAVRRVARRCSWREINRGLFRDFEGQIASYVNRVGSADVDIRFIYGNGGTRPTQIAYDVLHGGQKVLSGLFNY